MINWHVLILSFCLVLSGLGLFVYKVFILHFPLLPETSSQSWEVEVKIAFETLGPPVKVELQVPASRSQMAILNENFISHGFGLTTSKIEGQRVAIWSLRRPKGSQTLYYRALVEIREISGQSQIKMPELTEPQLEGAQLLAATSILEEAKQKSADLNTLVLQLFMRFSSEKQDEYVKILMNGKPSERRRLEAIVNILTLAGIRARTVHGIELDEQSGSAEIINWLEIFDQEQWISDKEQWVSFNAQSGDLEPVHNRLIFWRGPSKLVNLTGGNQLRVEIAKRPIRIESLSIAGSREQIYSPDLWQFSLDSLPLATQNVYRILLLVPIGAFILVIMRNIIGIKTIGTFMPVLIALSFRETHLIAGLILFTLLVSLGLAIRFYLDRLKLLLVPRLAAVLIIVILLMLFVSILSHELGIESGLSVALFPMVILTMTIERMSIVWEERGPLEAIQQGAGSLLVATLAFLVMSIENVEHMISVFPELLLVLLAATILLGRYTGYRLLELRRFKSLVNQKL